MLSIENGFVLEVDILLAQATLQTVKIGSELKPRNRGRTVVSSGDAYFPRISPVQMLSGEISIAVNCGGTVVSRYCLTGQSRGFDYPGCWFDSCPILESHLVLRGHVDDCTHVGGILGHWHI